MKKEERCVHVTNDNQVKLIPLEIAGGQELRLWGRSVSSGRAGLRLGADQGSDRSRQGVVQVALLCPCWKQHCSIEDNVTMMGRGETVT